jgi:hypothetical protein
MIRYILWSKVIRDQIQKETNGDFACVGRELGKRWKSLTKKEKEPYIRMAAQKQIDYAKAISVWIMNNPERKNEILDDVPSKKRKKSQQTSKKKKKEKMIPTGFQIFQREQRPIIRFGKTKIFFEIIFFFFTPTKNRKANTNKNLNNKESFGLISKQVSSNWKNLTPKEKEKYNREAAKKIATMEHKEVVKKPPQPKMPPQTIKYPNFMQQAPPKVMDYLNLPTKNFSPVNINFSKSNLQLNHPHVGSLHHPQVIQHPLLQLPNNKVYHPNLISETVHNDLLQQNLNHHHYSNDNSLDEHLK